MKFQIKHIKIENFRGIEYFDTDLWRNTIVSGPNEANKSNFSSAITWTLFSKSIESDSTFDVVPYSRYGEVSPCVTLECALDERFVTLQRKYLAKKTRDGKFSEYQTVCAVNGLECGPQEFKNWLSSNICDESILRILVTPQSFMDAPAVRPKELPWQSQRRMLMSIIGGQRTDAELARETNKWLDLVEPIDRHSGANVYLAYLKKKFSTLQKNMDDFYVRIDQQQGNIKPVDHTADEIETLLAHLSQDLKTLEQKNEEYRRSQTTAEMQKQQERQDAILSEIQQLQTKYNEDLLAYEKKKRELSDNTGSIISQFESKKKTLKDYISALETLQNKKISDVCQTCGQKLTDKAIEASKAQIASRIKNGEKMIADLKAEIERLQKLQKQCEERERQLPHPVYPAKVKTLQEELSSMRKSQPQVDVVYDMENYAEERRKILDQQEQLKHERFIVANNAEIESIIRSIEAEQQDMVKELSETQRMLELTKQFVSEKFSNAENAINSLFENVRFRLFEKNKTTDEYRECCTLTYNEIAYKDLSTSTKIVASLEVAKAFQKAYNINSVVIIDNAESIAGAIETDSQTICCYVKSEPCPSCGSHRHSRRKTNGKWKCFDCGSEFSKKLEIKEG